MRFCSIVGRDGWSLTLLLIVIGIPLLMLAYRPRLYLLTGPLDHHGDHSPRRYFVGT